MTDLRAAAQQALEAMLNFPGDISDEMFESMRSLKAALAEPVQEPVAWTLTKTLTERKTTTNGYLWFSDPQNCSWTPLYTTPPQRKPLTDEEATAIAWVGPVYAPVGVVTRTPTAYRRELEQTRMDAIRRTEAAHGIGSKT